MARKTVYGWLFLMFAVPLLASCATLPDPPPGTVFQDCDDCPEMVAIPAGTFRMGRGATDPRRDVTIDYGFAMGRHEVTFDEWDACVADGGCNGYVPDDEGWGRGRRPVINVGYDDATAYTGWLSRRTGHTYRLPSEAEWEYAALGGEETFFVARGDSSIICPFANHNDNRGFARSALDNESECSDGFEFTAPVGTYEPNGYGLFDTLGNVDEVVEDCISGDGISFLDGYQGAPVNGAAHIADNCTWHAHRGGNWVMSARNIRPTQRRLIWSPAEGWEHQHDERRYFSGFRVVRELGTRGPAPVSGNVLVILNHDEVDPLIAACDAGDGVSCSRLGYMFDRSYSSDVVQNEQAANAFWERSCEQGYYRICPFAATRASPLMQHVGPESRAMELLAIGCDGGSDASCRHRASLLYGHAVRMSRPRAELTQTDEEAATAARFKAEAISIWDSQCTGGDARSCLTLLDFFREGEYEEDRTSYTLTLLDEQCVGGDAELCEQLGYFYEVGEGVGQSVEYATGLYDRACRLGYREACCPSERARSRADSSLRFHPRSCLEDFERRLGIIWNGDELNPAALYDESLRRPPPPPPPMDTRSDDASRSPEPAEVPE